MLIRSQIDVILAARKTVAVGRRFRQKSHRDYLELAAEVTCADFPEFNFLYRCNVHCSRVPRKISHLLLADGQRIFALDINPGGSHRNLSTLESVQGTHWQIGPDMEAEADGRDLTHAQWHHEFAKRAGLEFDAYLAPPFATGAAAIGDMFEGMDNENL